MRVEQPAHRRLLGMGEAMLVLGEVLRMSVSAAEGQLKPAMTCHCVPGPCAGLLS